MIQFKQLDKEIKKKIHDSCVRSRDAYNEPKSDELGFYHITSKFLDQQVYVKETRGGLFISIRGTEIKKFRDLRTDLKAMPKFTRKGIVHSGFYSAALAIYKELNSRINMAVYQGKLITIEGHSMGGSVAMVLGFIIPDKCKVIAIAPIPCMRLFFGYKSELWIIKNASDPIPRIRLYKVYRQYGTVIQIGEGKDDFGSLTEAIKEIGEIKEDIQHHAIVKYCKNTK
jgi:predicted lipase